MRIERISDNQIRCTLNKKDLSDRQLKISELAYGSEKAKALFQDMMQQASYEFGFEADDIPLMIEAIPVSKETIVLVITKVDDPDELETRFSKFTDTISDDDTLDEDEDEDEDIDSESITDEIINCLDQLNDFSDKDESEKDNDRNDEKVAEFIPLHETLQPSKRKKKTTKKQVITPPIEVLKVFTFHNLEEIIKLSEQIIYCYHGKNSVYKDESDSTYYLLLNKSDHSAEEFKKAVTMAMEFGSPMRSTYATLDYFTEHYKRIIENDALQILSVM